MNKKSATVQKTERPKSAESSSKVKKHFTEPKLTFVEPKLTKQGDATKITGQGFFGTFSP